MFTYEFNFRAYNMGDSCDSETFLREIDPRVLYKENDLARQARVDERLTNYMDW